MKFSSDSIELEDQSDVDAFNELVALFKKLENEKMEKAKRVFEAYCNNSFSEKIDTNNPDHDEMIVFEIDQWQVTVNDAIRENLNSQTLGAFIEIVIANRKKVSARVNALKRHASDPKKRDKDWVRECWDEWQRRPTNYKTKSAFASDMLKKGLRLESKPVIQRWCREWAKETVTLLAK